MPETQRYAWDFKPSQSLQVDFREARALEFIAYYLDKIEQHLSRNADANEKIQASLAAISVQVPGIVRGVNQK